MDILNQFDGKINGVLETFDRIIINGYIQPLHSFRLFLYYLIQKNILLKDFDIFARQQTDTLCRYIEAYIHIPLEGQEAGARPHGHRRPTSMHTKG